MLDQFHLFICQAELSLLFFYIHFIILFFFLLLLLLLLQALASEILLDVQEVKQQLMKRRRLRQASAVAVKGGLSAKSMIKAKSIAASILNMSENDLADIMDTDQVRPRDSGSTFNTNPNFRIYIKCRLCPEHSTYLQ